MAGDPEIVWAVRVALAGEGDPERAAQQQRYMKSAMPFRGLDRPTQKEVLAPILKRYAPADRAAWMDTVGELWDGAEFREERYAALALARHRVARPWRDAAAMPLFAHLVVTGAWWDLVDETAVHLIGDALARDREAITPTLRAWAGADDIWLRRTAVICQVGDKDRTDRDLLRFAVEANLEQRSFWVRKAIGWALRDFARSDPEWVRAEVARLGERLSGLSRREATKHLG